MKECILKINAAPVTIERIGLEKIKSEFIPNLIEKAFEKPSRDSRYVFRDSVSDLYYDPEYRSLVEETGRFRTMYNDVLKHYNKYGDFSYTKEFLSTIDDLKRMRRRLERKYRFIEHAYHISNESARNRLGLELLGRIGTGVDHLMKMSKLELFIETRLENSNHNNGLTVFSYLGDERLSLLAASPSRLQEYARTIESKLNYAQLYGRRRVESVHVNPVFTNVVLEKRGLSRSDLNIDIDYPNGDPGAECETMMLGILKNTGSRNATIALSGAKLDSVEESIQPLARKGYLRDVFSKGKSVIDYENSSYAECEE
ncbi:hypothetical protein IKE71_03105 [Candidatus Saccharibacteria bacterium]|nr:hypothetical protein [Candidatus Saccharibacteria bacterium]